MHATKDERDVILVLPRLLELCGGHSLGRKDEGPKSLNRGPVFVSLLRMAYPRKKSQPGGSDTHPVTTPALSYANEKEPKQGRPRIPLQQGRRTLLNKSPINHRRDSMGVKASLRNSFMPFTLHVFESVLDYLSWHCINDQVLNYYHDQRDNGMIDSLNKKWVDRRSFIRALLGHHVDNAYKQSFLNVARL
ncbi:hypothetical protein HAX54_053469 [Datura stramonium]|uniref:Uncharacterized protein n=1 Tax=Datura stramonium TaxID=4076 RepID=A0ABS8WTD0_DATST|nr:hypothetical protein [Datura stramonium]